MTLSDSLNSLANDPNGSKTQQSKPQQPHGNTSTGPSYTNPTARSSVRSKSRGLSSSSIPSSPTRSRSRCPLAAPDPYSEVAASDPGHITWLWKTVLSSRGDIVSPRGKITRTPSSIASVSRHRGQQTASTSTRASATSGGIASETAAKFTDADFMESVLEPYGITIRMTGINKDMRRFFNILELPSDPESRLDVYKKFAHGMWLEPTLDYMNYIRREYKAMQVYRSNQAEYSAFALRDLFLDGPRHPWLPEEEGEKCWLPIRLLQLVCKPSQLEWQIPPLIYPLKKRYEWDIRPDCAYYVSLQAFKSDFRTNVREHICVIQHRAFCPYLTIEFKKDGDSLDTACYQVAIASTIALYNRYRLKARALQANQNQWSEKDKDQMRHYGITFTASSWKLWCTVPKTFPEWTGCIMSSIYSGNCCILAGVQKLVSVINDIHYWGLETHGKSCKADIYTTVRSDPSADSNDISIVEDDFE
ncbi:hypothetical protein GGR51DRAFT_501348 [Nemania sp. FL0031]|nr:hypothetical protein GGR51DRAFT_501348 [Nemania sp. FL0031]